ncbi:MAG: ferredoxin--NADP(+) reductase [Sorangiineae bacterium NIC37A_2]|nr:MAG: ferredoxin--NADP(+) reductase [Sorangiineae bacterium NIC37A_2]
MAKTTTETVLEVEHFTEDLFRIRTTRSAAFRFIPGQFVMMGLPDIDEGRPLLRAYSVVSAFYEEFLEFFSIKVEGGPLTSRLKDVKVGDQILVGNRATGTLIVENLIPAHTLLMLSTGTGLAPFLSVIQDTTPFERFEKVVLVHCVRRVKDLAYREFLEKGIFENELVGELAREKFHYFPTVTREPFVNHGRITTHLDEGTIERAFGLPPLSLDSTRVMLCGNPKMLTDLQAYFDARGFSHGNSGERGHYLTERAFAPG